MWHLILVILNSALVRAGADVFTQNLSGKTAFTMLQENGDQDKVRRLIRRVEQILMQRFSNGIASSSRRYSVT